MLISTRGRYALRVLIDLAEHNDRDYIPMKEIAARQEISLKYLERIIPVLSKNGFIEGIQGKGGGYRLVKEPNECKIGDVLRLTEGGLAPVSCLKADAKPCAKQSECRTFPLWHDLYRLVGDYLDSKTLADIIKH